jgi:hypothetical protein
MIFFMAVYLDCETFMQLFAEYGATIAAREARDECESARIALSLGDCGRSRFLTVAVP